jgi:probable F420-dependent oxidoreductase
VHTTSPYAGSADGVIPGEYGRIVDPFIALARASAVTSRIKLGTGICLVPERNPLLLAKEIATLDRYSGGRFIFGIGAGWLREETEIMGADFEHRWSQTRESIEAMKQLWTQDEAEYHGRYYDFPPVKSLPKPAQSPHPPVYLGGKARNVFRRVVAYGDGWMPNRTSAAEIRAGRASLDELAESAGRDPKSIEIMAFGFGNQFRTREEIEELADAGADRITIWLNNTEGDAAIAEIEEIASAVL